MRLLKRCLFVLAGCAALTACSSASNHLADVQDRDGEQMTVGTVQREIRVGMSSAEVAEVLGSPNVVTTDEERREVWIYDRISTQTAYSTSEGGMSALIFAPVQALGGFLGSALLGGAATGNFDVADGAESTSQKTLTVIIKFDDAGLVRDFAYHTSRF
ncbi:MAG: hypothetical protein V3R98_10985 [Alphaproteobacteria bacterium]